MKQPQPSPCSECGTTAGANIIAGEVIYPSECPNCGEPLSTPEPAADLFGLSSAEFSPCRKYRYALWRWWDKEKPYCMFIGLNPSTADETKNDPTVRRCIGFAQDWGYGGLCMANLFAVCATDPRDMMNDPDPVGPENDAWLLKLSQEAGIVVAAWGTKGVFMFRDERVKKMVETLCCLRLTKEGHPQHPLYLPRSCRPMLMQETTEEKADG